MLKNLLFFPCFTLTPPPPVIAPCLTASIYCQIPYELVDRRPGDVASCYASCSLAETELGWRAERNLRDMCKYNHGRVPNTSLALILKA